MIFWNRQNNGDSGNIGGCQRRRERAVKTIFMILKWSLFVVHLLSHVQLVTTPWTPACQASLSLELVQTHVHWVDDATQLSCHPLLLLPSIFPSIRVFSNELALHIRWPKYWNFNFSISPSSDYSGLIPFRTDWFDLLAIQGDHMS